MLFAAWLFIFVSLLVSLYFLSLSGLPLPSPPFFPSTPLSAATAGGGAVHCCTVTLAATAVRLDAASESERLRVRESRTLILRESFFFVFLVIMM